MKKIFLTLLALPILLIACKQEDNTDTNLNGMWKAEKTTSQVSETYIYKFDEASLKTYKIRDDNSAQTKVQVEEGTYFREEDMITYKIAQHSCVVAASDYPTKKSLSYQLSDDMNTLIVTMSNLKKVKFERIFDETEIKHVDKFLNEGKTGCYVEENGKLTFKEGKVQKPTPIELTPEEQEAYLKQELEETFANQPSVH